MIEIFDKNEVKILGFSDKHITKMETLENGDIKVYCDTDWKTLTEEIANEAIKVALNKLGKAKEFIEDKGIEILEED